MEKMMQKMMQKYPLFIAMGFMIVLLSLVIGAHNSANAANYYAFDKATRDANLQLAQVRAAIESTTIWLPYFKFLGLGMILAGITMALGVISTKLRDMGQGLNSGVPEAAHQPLPQKPRSAMAMRIFMILGMMILFAGFFIALITAANARAVFSSPITALDAAAAGSALLADLAGVHATEAWLEAFKFVGIALLFLGIVNGLSSILFALSYQKKAIPALVDSLPAGLIPAPASGD